MGDVVTERDRVRVEVDAWFAERIGAEVAARIAPSGSDRALYDRGYVAALVEAKRGVIKMLTKEATE